MAESENKVKKQQQQNQSSGPDASSQAEHVESQPVQAAVEVADFSTLVLGILRDVSSGVYDMSVGRQKLDAWKKSLPLDARKEAAVQGRAFATRVRSIAEAVHQEWIGLTAYDI